MGRTARPGTDILIRDVGITNDSLTPAQTLKPYQDTAAGKPILSRLLFRKQFLPPKTELAILGEGLMCWHNPSQLPGRDKGACGAVPGTVCAVRCGDKAGGQSLGTMSTVRCGDNAAWRTVPGTVSAVWCGGQADVQVGRTARCAITTAKDTACSCCVLRQFSMVSSNTDDRGTTTAA